MQSQLELMEPRLFKVSDESLNSFGFRVLSSGGDFERFNKNPIALYNHMRPWRGTNDEILPIGTWSDIKVSKSGEITALFHPDIEEEFSQKIAKKVEKKVIVAASIGIIALEWSEDPKHLLPGQRNATVTKWELREISLVDIPSNANAVQLYDEHGKAINLSDQGAIQIPMLKGNMLDSESQTITSQKKTQMELKSLCLALGLAEDANSSAIELAVIKLNQKVRASEAKVVGLESELARVRQDETNALIATALADKRINSTQEQPFKDLFSKDFESAKKLLAGMAPQATLASLTQPGGSGNSEKLKYNGMTFSELSKDQPDTLVRIKESDYELFKNLFKSEYGSEYKG